MKKFLKIAGITLTLFLIYADSCRDSGENESQQKIIEDRRRELLRHFGDDYLTESSLIEHERIAKQKLTDFADYLNLLADTGLEIPFREKAGDMIRKSFLSDTIRVSLPFDSEKKWESICIGELVQAGLENRLPSVEFFFDTIRIKKPFQRTGEDFYSAILDFIARNKIDLSTEKLKSTPRISANMVIRKEQKLIGTDTLSIWILSLGGIY